MDKPEDNSSDTNADHDFVTTYCQVLKFTDMKGNTKEMYFPKNLDLERPKRSRTNFTIKQLKELEKSFAKNQYLVGKERKFLSKQLDLSEAQIKIWYQNRRTKHKKEQSKEKERMEANAESIAATNILNILEQRQQPYAQTSQQLLPNEPDLEEKNSNSCCLSSSESSQNCSSNVTTLNPMLTTNVNPFFYNIGNSQWSSDTNYLSCVYLSPTLLHK